MPALIEAWRAGLITRDSLARNVGAGLVVGIVALPLAMAFAIASGARPEQGLYTALVAGLLVTLLGGSRVQIAGPTGAFTVLLAGVTARYGLTGLQIVTIMAGGMLLLLGLSRLGGMIRYVPESVILGFTAGIALVIWIGQWPNFFGLEPVEGEALYQRLPNLIAALAHPHVATTLLGVVCVVIVVVWPRIPIVSVVPSPMVALVAATLFVAVVRPEGIATVGSTYGAVPSGLPPFTLPQLGGADLVALLRPALAVALLGAIESLLSATVADGMLGTRHDPNQELVGQGIANIGAGFFGGFAATGALARTATSVRHGGDNPVAGIVHAATVLLVLVALAPLAYYVPLTALAAVLFVVAFNMSHAGRLVRTARRAPRSDVAIMLVTLGLTVLVDVTVAVEVGVILALLNFFRRMIATVGVRVLDADEVAERAGEAGATHADGGVIVYTVEGPFFFGAVEEFESALVHTDTDPRAVVIKLVDVPFIDLSGLAALRDAVDALERRGVMVALCGASEGVAKALESAQIVSSVDLSPRATLGEALEAIERGRGDDRV